MTEHAKHFFNPTDLGEVDWFSDSDEWNAWQNRGDDVLHVELGKWADIFLLAPLDANSLGKIASVSSPTKPPFQTTNQIIIQGVCDNMLLCTVRAWDVGKPLVFCPAMNTKMYQHPITSGQLETLKLWGYVEVPVVEKTLICGDVGLGAMAEVSTIVQVVVENLNL